MLIKFVLVAVPTPMLRTILTNEKMYPPPSAPAAGRFDPRASVPIDGSIVETLRYQ